MSTAPALVSRWSTVRVATQNRTGPLTVAVLAAQVVAAASAAGAVPFDLVGFSLGSAVATFIAAEY